MPDVTVINYFLWEDEEDREQAFQKIMAKIFCLLESDDMIYYTCD